MLMLQWDFIGLLRSIIMAAWGKGIGRADLYAAVYRASGLSRGESADLTDEVLREIMDCLVKGETVKLSSFGTFTVRKKGKRLGRNPKNGVEAIIEPRSVVLFKASPIFKMKLNAKASFHSNS
jgi:integration host factor subunit alpha